MSIEFRLPTKQEVVAYLNKEYRCDLTIEDMVFPLPKLLKGHRGLWEIDHFIPTFLYKPRSYDDCNEWFNSLPDSNSSTQNNNTMRPKIYHFNGSSFETLGKAANTALLHWKDRNCQCAIDFLKTHADAIDKEITISKENWPAFKAAHLQPKQLTFAQIAEQVKQAQTALEADKINLDAIRKENDRLTWNVAHFRDKINGLQVDVRSASASLEKNNELIDRLKANIAKNEAILNKTV